MPRDYDVVIAGAGLVGASLACALAPLGLRIAVIEAVELGSVQQPGYDDRGLTLFPASKSILERLGLWKELAASATPIKQIHVSEQGRFGFTRLDSAQVGRQQLGHVVIARALGHAVHKKMRSYKNINLMCPASLRRFQRSSSAMIVELSVKNKQESVRCGLLVGADGSRSLVRRLAGINTHEQDFKQTAIVANITTQKTNDFTAYERFTRHGPIALLPVAKKRAVLVLTVNKATAEHYLSIDDRQYSKVIEKEFGRRLGNIEKTGRRCSYPVCFIEAVEQYRENLVLLGNAAHTLHPNAAQGFNLGLRDVAGLAECIAAGIKKNADAGDISILKNYLTLRYADQKRVIRFTNGLAAGFYQSLPLSATARNTAMLILDTLPGIKHLFVEKVMGVAGMQPKLVRGLQL